MKTLPRIDPIIPKKGTGPFDSPEYQFDLKYDGFRGVLYWDGAHCSLYSKRNNRLRFVALERSLVRCFSAHNIPGVILDGEVVSLDQSGRPVFANVQSRIGLSYTAFDLLWLDGCDLRGLPLASRRIMLEGLIRRMYSGCITRGFSARGTGTHLFRAICSQDLEGIIAKRRMSPYVTRAIWTKILNPAYSQNTFKRGLQWHRTRG